MPTPRSSSRALTLAFVMDPVEAEPMDGSTTIVLMREAQDRGHTVLYVDPDDLEIDAGRVRAVAVPIELDLDERDARAARRGAGLRLRRRGRCRLPAQGSARGSRFHRGDPDPRRLPPDDRAEPTHGRDRVQREVAARPSSRT